MSVVSGPLTTGRPAGVSNTLYPTQAPTFYYKGAAVKAPRFRIAWVMVAVAIAALDFTAIRALLGPYTNSLEYQKTMLLLLGALPMANVLAVGMLIGQRRPASRPFLLGFEAFGAMALALSIALASCFPEEVVMRCLVPFGDLVEKIIGPNRPFVFIPILCLVAVVVLGGPQVAFALMGGFLSRRFKIAVTPR